MDDQFTPPLPTNGDRIEANLNFLDNQIRESIETITAEGTLEQKLNLRALLYLSIVLLDSMNPGLNVANESGH